MIDRPRTGGLHASALCMGETRPALYTMLRLNPVELAVMQFASPLALCAFGSQPGETCTLSDIARFLSKSGNLWLRPPHRLLALMYVGPGRHFYQVLLTANGTQSAFLNT